VPWVYLIIAGIFEIVWASFLKLSEGFTKLNYSIVTILGMLVSFFFLSQATRTLPIGTAYAIWTGIGAIGAVIVGVVMFKEPVSFARAVFIILVIAGIVGLKFTSAH
jgi:quaternary ammonium compound-resistance protein SugE